MMHKLVPALILAALAVAKPVEAQEYPRGEIFGGFSVYDGNTIVYGWQASAVVNATEHIGFVADFGGHYDDGINSHEYLFGPRFRTPRARFVGFAHALFGTQRLSSPSLSRNNLAMGIGGGLDLITDSGLGFRLVQFDWLPTRFGGTWFDKNYRYGFGVVIPLGN